MLKTTFLLLGVLAVSAAEPLTIGWTNNMLRISGPQVPGDYVEIWYLEAFCRSGSTHRKWEETTIPHRTELLSATPQKIRLRTKVEPNVLLEHEISAGVDEVDFNVTIRNEGKGFADVQWFQPCMRVDRFTGAKQTNYIEKSFIFTQEGVKLLSKLPRKEEAIYRGGQVYVPEGVPMADVNPRPISEIKPSNAVIGCYSKDGKRLLATAWDSTQELFQGVIVCLHNDPRIGGLKLNETKTLHGKVYIMDNDIPQLLARYRKDFPRK
ncbi:MAG TPA: hypothetical protein VF773_10695 [Verrucomicrobiae bacterium]